MDEVQAAIYSYFHDGELPPEPPTPRETQWKPDPPKQWWSIPENRPPQKISEEVTPKDKS